MLGTLANLKDFLIELYRYYMEFLESDFKEQRPPSRRVSGHDKDGMLKDVKLTRFPRLNHHILALLASNFESGTPSQIVRNQFVIKYPQAVIEGAREIEGPVLNQEKKIIELLAEAYKTQKLTLREETIQKILENIKLQKITDLATFFSATPMLDFYDDLHDLWKNKQVLERQDFYLYFSDIRYTDITYPLFYLPISIERTDEGAFNLEFDPVFLINKKAVEYISKKYAEDEKKEWKPDLPPRHVYLSNFEKKGELLKFLQGVFNGISDFFGLKAFPIDSSEVIEVGNGKVKLTNACYLSLFDKSDEALLNDYEELLTLALAGSDHKALEIFTKLSNDYLFENPITLEREVEEEYESQPVGDKFAYSSPISLNKEQLEVLRALRKKECSRVVIEGPPGTGKSHTITAIIYDALLNKKSVLMVSDKKEALDVVEEKISGVLDRMKLDDFVQNPILRLGKKDNNFNRIFNQNNFDKIKNRFNTYKRHREQIEADIGTTLQKIKKDIGDEIQVESCLSPTNLEFLLQFEETFDNVWDGLLDIDELEDVENSSELLRTLWIAVNDFKKQSERLWGDYEFEVSKSATTLPELQAFSKAVNKTLDATRQKIKQEQATLISLKDINSQKVGLLEECLVELKKLKIPVFGYLFSVRKVETINARFKEAFFLSNIGSIKEHTGTLMQELLVYKHCLEVSRSCRSLDVLKILKENSFEAALETIKELEQAVTRILQIHEKLPKNCAKLEINIASIDTMGSNRLLNFKKNDLEILKRYLDTSSAVLSGGLKVAGGSFTQDRITLENRLVSKMTNILDESVINFREANRNDAEELRKIVRAKKKIPKNLLKKLVEAFPCLIVSIRELGEFIPLEPNIFDVVVIDEASQVSIAQAFPAILRGKQIVVLGDPKQYTNVKSHNASISVNNFLFNRVREAFSEGISTLPLDERDLIKGKVVNFNIKNSILDFMKNITNYQCALKKHFRGYIEIIGYSNETFYQNSLQVMKIRGKSIKDVIQFFYIDAGSKEEIYKNTNRAEADFIVSQLEALRAESFKGTVGIITPFTNQQKLITNLVYDSPNWKHYQSEFNLKIMTFDSCQGDEKDIIYYSMVEKPAEDILKYIFPVKLQNLEDEEDGNLKAQRLNVGLSRAKESVRFVLCKKSEDVRGEIGKALQFFKSKLESPDYVEALEKTESPMERELLNLVIQTPFYLNNKENIDIIPQFQIGKYMKQLNPTAQIPNYRADFLFIHKDGSNARDMIILEYDGFEYHFKDTGFVSEANFDKFYVEDDVERRKTIESYGYDFIRLNKFILRDDPIDYLNEQLERHCKKKL